MLNFSNGTYGTYTIYGHVQFITHLSTRLKYVINLGKGAPVFLENLHQNAHNAEKSHLCGKNHTKENHHNEASSEKVVGASHL